VQASGVPASEYHPITIVSSSTLEVGQYVVAIGNPFGLSRSMTFGIISQLGRTIQDPTAGNFSIADIVQFSAPINPGNSGGVLLDADGFVVGITTAVVSGSQGVGFAIPSDTIIRELPDLITSGSYNFHAYLGISGVDMSYQLAQAAHTNYTYGVLIEEVVSGGPADQAGIKAGTQTVTVDGVQYLVGGDIIVSANGTKITDNDALATYLAENTLSGQTAMLGIIRNGALTTVDVTLGTRPPVGS
jgi:S1-C subfamily serine protease